MQTRRAQLMAYNDRRGVALAVAFAAGKITNQANLLKYMAKYRKETDPECIANCGGARARCWSTSEELRQLGGGHHGRGTLPVALGRRARSAKILGRAQTGGAGRVELAGPR